MYVCMYVMYVCMYVGCGATGDGDIMMKFVPCYQVCILCHATNKNIKYKR